MDAKLIYFILTPNYTWFKKIYHKEHKGFHKEQKNKISSLYICVLCVFLCVLCVLKNIWDSFNCH